MAEQKFIHLCLVSHKKEIVKKCRPRSDAAERGLKTRVRIGYGKWVIDVRVTEALLYSRILATARRKLTQQNGKFVHSGDFIIII